MTRFEFKNFKPRRLIRKISRVGAKNFDQGAYYKGRLLILRNFNNLQNIA